MPTLSDRFQGCLLGGAVGDALGAPIEFLSLADIRARFGPDGLTRETPDAVRAGITDDTQMTLFTAEGLLRAHNARIAGGAAGPEAEIAAMHRAYLRWDYTQREAWPSLAPPRSDRSGWLLEQPFLHRLRAPGRTCLSALRGDRRGTIAQPLNASKGCGGVMRVAPVGLAHARPFAFAVEAAALTHGHPSGYLSAGALAAMIAALVAGHSLEEAVDRAGRELSSCDGHEETTAALQKAVALARSGAPPSAEAVESLGQGWVGDEALAIAVYCSLTAADLADGVTRAVNHGGDSDSTGAITGNLLGAALGAQAIPRAWRDALEGAELMTRVAADLFDMVTYAERAVDPVRYPPD
jgi:ADP-ribosyl-[dinitrogen reductase] hydrolase